MSQEKDEDLDAMFGESSDDSSDSDNDSDNDSDDENSSSEVLSSSALESKESMEKKKDAPGSVGMHTLGGDDSDGSDSDSDDSESSSDSDSGSDSDYDDGSARSKPKRAKKAQASSPSPKAASRPAKRKPQKSKKRTTVDADAAAEGGSAPPSNSGKPGKLSAIQTELARKQNCEMFHLKMRQAYKDDEKVLRARKNGSVDAGAKPALAKLGMIASIRRELVRRNLHSIYIDNKILSTIAMWLRASSDGKLPNLSIRTTMLEVLQNYTRAESINMDNAEHLLKRSGIGKAVQLLAQSEQETPKNRAAAKALITKWFSLVQAALEYQYERHIPVSMSVPPAGRAGAAGAGSGADAAAAKDSTRQSNAKTNKKKRKSQRSRAMPFKKRKPTDGYIKSLNEYTRSVPAPKEFGQFTRRPAPRQGDGDVEVVED